MKFPIVQSSLYALHIRLDPGVSAISTVVMELKSFLMVSKESFVCQKNLAAFSKTPVLPWYKSMW